MKRYLLFVYEEGYDSYNSPKGWDAFEGDFEDAQEAAAEGQRQCPPNNGCDESVWEVVDTAVKKIVLRGRSGAVSSDPQPTAAEIAAHPEMRPINVRIA